MSVNFQKPNIKKKKMVKKAAVHNLQNKYLTRSFSKIKKIKKPSIGSLIRKTAKQEKVIKLDCSYLASPIDAFWSSLSLAQKEDKDALKEIIKNIILQNIHPRHSAYFDKVSKAGKFISGICLTGVFTIIDEALSYIVHEALSELFHLKDIKFPYEDHKKLYLKKEGIGVTGWSNGSGEISPHSDDIYEDIEIDLLSLTVCKDKLNVPTTFYQMHDIFQHLSDPELEKLSRTSATFISGKNVRDITKMRSRKLVSFDGKDVTMFLDFRIDDEKGERMIPRLRSDRALLDKIKSNLDKDNCYTSTPGTGTFLVIANFKGLHSRAELDLQKITEKEHDDAAPRILFRSKGPKF